MVQNIFTYAGMQWYGCLILTIDCIMAKHITDWYIPILNDLTACQEQLFMC